jgi:hypothetical protein
MQTLAALGLLARLLACQPSGPTATVQTKNGAVPVAIEVARTDATRQRGLMYRNQVPDGHGMLFVFDDDSDRIFWMKNTLVPLDIIFIGPDLKIVGIARNTTPLSLAPISVGRASRWVLEVAGGYAAHTDMAIGDKIDLTGIPPA